MATVKEHYDHLLSDVYSWMSGGFDSGIVTVQRPKAFLIGSEE